MENPLINRRVMVTGAGGFIGSHLVEVLVSSGARVRAFVRYNSKADIGYLSQLDPATLHEVEIVFGDLRNPDAVKEIVKDRNLVFHLAALISIPYSYQHPREVVETNVLGTLNILQACLDHGIEKLIHTSTSEVYGSALFVPIKEDHPLQGQSPYSASKIGADKLVESYFCSYNLPVTTIRPFNTYGPRQSARAVIPTIITQALKSDIIKLGSLDTRRDFTYVSDTVNGFVKAAVSERSVGQTINLGTGSDVSIGELAEKIITIIGRPVSIDIDTERIRPEKSEVVRLISDNHLAHKAIDWKPEIDFDEGLTRTIEWIQTHIDHYRVGIYER